MKMGRIAALVAALLLGSVIVTVVRASPWHVPHLQGVSGAQRGTPTLPHFHSMLTNTDGGYWHAIPTVEPGAAHFADRDRNHDRWRHGDIRYFHHYDWYAWHNGYWYNGWYGPRFGW